MSLAPRASTAFHLLQKHPHHEPFLSFPPPLEGRDVSMSLTGHVQLPGKTTKKNIAGSHLPFQDMTRVNPPLANDTIRSSPDAMRLPVSEVPHRNKQPAKHVTIRNELLIVAITIVAVVAQLLASNSVMKGATARLLLFLSMIFELFGVLLAIIYHQFCERLREGQSPALLRFVAWTAVVLILTGMIILKIALFMELV